MFARLAQRTQHRRCNRWVFPSHSLQIPTIVNNHGHNPEQFIAIFKEIRIFGSDRKNITRSIFYGFFIQDLDVDPEFLPRGDGAPKGDLQGSVRTPGDKLTFCQSGKSMYSSRSFSEEKRCVVFPLKRWMPLFDVCFDLAVWSKSRLTKTHQSATGHDG